MMSICWVHQFLELITPMRFMYLVVLFNHDVPTFLNMFSHLDVKEALLFLESQFIQVHTKSN